jgi:ligand-binding sensor domain-containing protein
VKTSGKIFCLSLFIFAFLLSQKKSALAEGVWEHYTSTYSINDIAVKGNDVWYATDGGVVHRNVATGTYRKYTEENCLAENGIKKILIDSNGIVWAIGRNSLSRFDGTKWESVPDGGRFDGNETLFLKVDNNGKIWVSSYHFLWCYDGHTWTDIEIPETYVNFRVSDFTIDHKGVVWICANGNGIIQYNGSEWKIYSTDNVLPNNSAYKTLTASDGKVWFIFNEWNGSIGYFNEGEWHIDKYEDGTISSPQSITQTPDNKIWVGTSGRLNCYDGISWIKYDAKVFGTYNIVSDDSGNLWMTANQGGLASFDCINWTFYDLPPDLNGNTICSLALAPDGKLWIGDLMGYSVFDGTNFEPHYNLFQNLSQCSVYPIFFASDGKICMGVGGGIFIYDNSEWLKRYIVGSHAANNTVNSIAESRDGTIWFGTITGMFYYKDGILTELDFFKTISAIFSVVSDRKGNIWAGTSNGVYYYNGSMWTRIGAGDPVASRRVTSILIAKNGDVWAAGYGAACYSKGQWTSYTTENGFPLDYCDCVAADSTGTMWFGDNKLVSFDGKSFREFTETDGFSCKYIRNIAVSPSNEIWIATNDNYYTYDGVSIKKVISSGGGYLYGGSLLFDKNGVVWVGTGFGLFKYTPDTIIDFAKNTTTPSPFTLNGNYPNPFNPNTTISFSLGKESPVEIAVYNISGQKVKTLFSGVMPAGNHVAAWNGKNEQGQRVSSGVYFARFISGNMINNHKMLLLR